VSRWTFFGRILLERIPLSVEGPELTGEALGVRYRSKVLIRYGQFIALVTIENGQTDIETLRNLLENDVRILTDLIGYLRGGSFDVDFVSAVSDDGSSVTFGITNPALLGARQGPLGEIDSDLLRSVALDTPARMVLANFREAVRSPVDTGFFCYRAIEAMMRSMKTSPKDSDKTSWDLLRTRLQVDRPVIDAIKAHADDARHGNISSISDDERGKVFRLSDEIVRRYLTYLRRGKTTLPSSEFPLFVLPDPKP